MIAESSPTPAQGDVPKQRLCLVCRAEFPSEGFGERVCRRCKSSKSWKSGRMDGSRDPYTRT